METSLPSNPNNCQGPTVNLPEGTRWIQWIVKKQTGIFHSQLSEISRAKHPMAPDARTWMLKSWRIYHRPWWRKPVSSRPMAWYWRPMAVGLPTWSSCRSMLGKRASDVEMLGLKMTLKMWISLENIWKYNFWDVWGNKTLDCQWE